MDPPTNTLKLNSIQCTTRILPLYDKDLSSAIKRHPNKNVPIVAQEPSYKDPSTVQKKTPNATQRPFLCTTMTRLQILYHCKIKTLDLYDKDLQQRPFRCTTKNLQLDAATQQFLQVSVTVMLSSRNQEPGTNYQIDSLSQC